MIVLDTNVVSELMRPAPARAVTAWLDRQLRNETYTTAVTLAEIRYGLARMPDGARRAGLIQAGANAFGIFPDTLLPFDERAAGAYAELMVASEAAGKPIDTADAMIAAICVAHSALLATRDIADFAGTGVALVDPWLES